MTTNRKKWAYFEKISIVLLVFSWIILIFYHSERFNSETSDIDHLAATLDSLIPTISGKPRISFFTNALKKDKLLFEIQFLFAPTILERNSFKNDTILLINEHDLEDFSPLDDSFKSIYETSGNTYNINLLVRI